MTDTVCSLLGLGAIFAEKRTTVDDLLFAAEWLEAYEGDPEEDVDILVVLDSVARKPPNGSR